MGDVCGVITKGTTPTSVGYNFIREGINFIKVENRLKEVVKSFGKVKKDTHTIDYLLCVLNHIINQETKFVKQIRYMHEK